MSIQLYNHLPITLQNLACSIKGFIEKRNRFGGEFSSIYEYLKKSQWMTREEIANYQLSKLKYIVDYCYNNVPYYRNLFDDLELEPGFIKDLSDISKIPILTKDIVRDNFEQLKSASFKGKSIQSNTSGSTGKALKFMFSEYAIHYRWALWYRHRDRFGATPDHKYATFTGQPAVPLKQNKPPYWRENYPMRQTIFTMHHITKEKVPHIVKRLNKTRFFYYTGYPSILYSLANLIEELELEIYNPPEVIFTGAEALLDYQKLLIEKVFKTYVTDQYGFSEGCGNASRCEEGYYHEDFEYGVLECNNPIYHKDGSKTGEILATGFTNLAMPFLRYQVGDTATWKDIKCECGRESNVILKIDGRSEDFVLTPEGAKILRFDYIFKQTYTIKEAQVIQKELGGIIIRIVRNLNYNRLREEKEILNKIRQKISPTIKVSFEYTDKIEREATGKLRAVKSYLK